MSRTDSAKKFFRIFLWSINEDMRSAYQVYLNRAEKENKKAFKPRIYWAVNLSFIGGLLLFVISLMLRYNLMRLTPFG